MGLMALAALSSLRHFFVFSRVLLKKRDQTVCIHLWHCKAVLKRIRMHSPKRLQRMRKKKLRNRKSSRLCKGIESSLLSGQKTRLAVVNPSFRRSTTIKPALEANSYCFLY